MNLKLVVRPQVDTDLLEAEAYYEQQQVGLGREFLQDIIKTIERLLINPFIYRVRYRRQVRWAYARRFPYRIVFRVIDNTVVVYAVIHAARYDQYWKRRVTESGETQV